MRNKKTTSISLRTLAKTLNGEIYNLAETSDIEITNIAVLMEATEKDISFVSAAGNVKKAQTSKAAAFLAPKGLIIEGRPTLCIEQVWKGVLWLINYFYPEELPAPGVDKTAQIGKNVALGKDVYIGAYTIVGDNVCIGDGTVIDAQCYIGEGTHIGKNCRIFPRVTIMDKTQIGNNVIIHSGVVIGSDGYRYEVLDGVRTKLPQVGYVIIEDDVEIGANTCIDRALLSATRIGKGTKIDNLVHIAHNVSIGRNCLIIAQVGIAGSSTIGDNCILAGQVGIADNVHICNDVMLGAKSGVHRDITESGAYLGIPALPAKHFARVVAAMQKLPELMQQWRHLVGRVDQLIEHQDSPLE